MRSMTEKGSLRTLRARWWTQTRSGRRDPQSGRFASTFPRKGERDVELTHLLAPVFRCFAFQGALS